MHSEVYRSGSSGLAQTGPQAGGGVCTRRLVGAGQVHGVKFLPGGFRAFAAGSVQDLTDQVLSADRTFGPEAAELWPRVLV
ncbi:hypothetical protein GCM10010430_55710 [Kitasatospora cystarginea]|uniref:Uncharacterized protein n=1 Tax=Kitasatospora cystarginea TaxID=58350 RepID=A0ABN3ENC1_9ACTN